MVHIILQILSLTVPQLLLKIFNQVAEGNLVTIILNKEDSRDYSKGKYL